MSDIQIAGATYNDVPSILVPKVGGGFAEYTEGGGGGSLKPFVLRPDAELVQQWTYDKLIVEDEGKTIPAYSTSQSTFIASRTLETITPDYSGWNYIILLRALAYPIYSDSTKAKGRQEYFSFTGFTKIIEVPANTYTAFDGTTVPSRLINANSLNIFRMLYWTSASAVAATIDSGYGANLNPVTTGLVSSAGVISIKSPTIRICGNATYLSSDMWALITDVRYQYIIELWRAPKGNAGGDGWQLTQGVLHIADCYKNGGKLT